MVMRPELAVNRMAKPMKEVIIRRPDDFHVHFREGLAMCDAVRHCVLGGKFGRALVMPNTRSPIVNGSMAVQYGRQIIDAVPSSSFSKSFSPLMTLYLTDETSPDDIYAAARMNEDLKGSLGPFGGIVACKLYPANATTNSKHGVTDVRKLKPVMQAMKDVEFLLLVHGESTHQGVDIFDREKVFLDETMNELVSYIPGLKIVLEHITTAEAVEFIMRNTDPLSKENTLAATITPQHLLLNRNALFTPGLRPHHFCLPVLKRENHRQERSPHRPVNVKKMRENNAPPAPCLRFRRARRDRQRPLVRLARTWSRSSFTRAA